MLRYVISWGFEDIDVGYDTCKIYIVIPIQIIFRKNIVISTLDSFITLYSDRPTDTKF